MTFKNLLKEKSFEASKHKFNEKEKWVYNVYVGNSITQNDLGEWCWKKAIIHQWTGGILKKKINKINKMIDWNKYSLLECVSSIELWSCPSKVSYWEIAIACLGEKEIKKRLKELRK